MVDKTVKIYCHGKTFRCKEGGKERRVGRVIENKRAKGEGGEEEKGKDGRKRRRMGGRGRRGGRKRAERYGLTNTKTLFPVEVDLNHRPCGFSLVPPVLPIIKIDFCKNHPHRCTGKRYHGIEKAYDPQ